ncbi:MAG: hypothetical protein IJ661_07750 [Lachnospiraceae bacterium]|nr:hypothetical protein [Lachnospiraceae bacterium]
MNERYNRILHNIFIYGLIATVSFLTFAFIITSVNTNLFLSIAASILLLILLKIANVINWEALRNIIFLEVPITVGFVIAKLYQGVPIDGICDYAGVADKHSFCVCFYWL